MLLSRKWSNSQYGRPAGCGFPRLLFGLICTLQAEAFSLLGSVMASSDRSEEEQQLREFNDPFEPVSGAHIRRRLIELDPSISERDEQMLISLMDNTGLEDSLINDSCQLMVSMNLVNQTILSELQESFDFEKVLSAFSHVNSIFTLRISVGITSNI